VPELVEINDGHFSRCFRALELKPLAELFS
jgi:hypothetical protein